MLPGPASGNAAALAWMQAAGDAVSATSQPATLLLLSSGLRETQSRQPEIQPSLFNESG